MRNVALTLIIALCLASLTSCRTSRQTTTTVDGKADTTIHSTYRSGLYMQPIPRAEVSFNLSTSSLPINIPIVYFSDRGHVEVERTAGDTIRITAVCDSLQQLVSFYEYQLDELKTRAENTTTVETIVKPVPWFYKAALWLNVALLLYIFIPYIVPLIKRMLTKKQYNG